MQAFTRLTGIAAPLPMANLSTDDIFPGTQPEAAGKNMAYSDPSQMGANAFANLRWDEDGHPRAGFILNQKPWAEAKILVGRDNFACGSSREHAVWCLTAIGIRCIVAPSFGEIFHGNCFKNGVLPVILDASRVERLLRLVADPASAVLTVDLMEQVVVDVEGARYEFDVDTYLRHLLLEGLDEITASLNALPAFEEHERAYLERRPWLRSGT